MNRILLLSFVLMLLPSLSLAKVTGAACQPFFESLDTVPHESIFQRDGNYPSEYFQTSAEGCFLVMVTSRTMLGGHVLPALDGSPGSALYDAGWRSNPKYLVDGPGTGVVGLENRETLCLVYTSQPSYVDDNGQVVQAEHISIRVECMDGVNSEREKMILQEKKEEGM